MLAPGLLPLPLLVPASDADLELIGDESWTEHLRRFDRVTASDVALRDRKLAFHVGDAPPLVTRYFADTL